MVCSHGQSNEKRCLIENEQEKLRKVVNTIYQKKESYSQLLEIKKAERPSVFITEEGDYVSQEKTEEESQTLGNVLYDDINSMWEKTKVDHAIHLL